MEEGKERVMEHMRHETPKENCFRGERGTVRRGRKRESSGRGDGQGQRKMTLYEHVLREGAQLFVYSLQTEIYETKRKW